MNLLNLVGLSVKDAEDKIKSENLVPRTFTVDQAVISLSLPKNVVQIRYNDSTGLVVSAETQESIDAKYSH